MRLRWIVLIVALAATPLSATVFIPAEFREIVDDATLIVRGRVTDVRTEHIRDRGIETVAAVAVEAVLKGDAASFVSVRVPGGSQGGVRSIVVGAPRLTLNDHAVFFLKRGGDLAWRPVGLSMGVQAVRFDRATRQMLVNAPVMLGQTASVGPVVRGDARRRPMVVQQYDALVRLVVNRAGASR